MDGKSERVDAPMTGRDDVKWKIAVFPAYSMPSTGVLHGRECDGDALDRYVDTWKRLIPKQYYDYSDDADYEDWVEQAARLDAGVRILPDDTVIAIRREGGRVYDLDGAPVNPGFLYGRAQLGPLASIVTPDSVRPDDDMMSDRYHLNPVIREAMGRESMTAAGDAGDLTRVMDDMVKRHGKVFLKDMASSKTFACAVTRDEWENREGSEWWEEAGWENVRFEGDDDVWLVQEYVDMTWETRFMCMLTDDGIRPITGAGCVEEYTPLQRTAGNSMSWRGISIDDRARRVRRGGVMPPEAVPEVMERLADHAIDVCARIGQEGGLSDWFSLDMAMVGDRPVVVETNGLSNSGLYACDMDALVTAMRDCPHPFIPASFSEIESNAVEIVADD